MIKLLKRIVRPYYNAFLENKRVQSLLSNRAEVNRLIQNNLSTAFMHRDLFPQYKGINSGKSVVLLASGPSLSKYKDIPDCVKVGVNQVIMKFDDLDYYFIEDIGGSDWTIRDKILSYTGKNCKKFFGIAEYWKEDPTVCRVISESDLITAKANRFVVDSMRMVGFKNRFALDISTQPLGGFGSIVFPAMQFILWTNPETIYIVGCDCSNGGHFFGDNEDTSSYDAFIKPWVQLKEFAKMFYPETKIVSVNPVRLRGLFEDLDQEA